MQGRFFLQASCIRTDRGNIQTAGADSDICIHGDKDNGDGGGAGEKKKQRVNG